MSFYQEHIYCMPETSCFAYFRSVPEDITDHMDAVEMIPKTQIAVAKEYTSDRLEPKTVTEFAALSNAKQLSLLDMRDQETRHSKSLKRFFKFNLHPRNSFCLRLLKIISFKEYEFCLQQSNQSSGSITIL